MASDRNRFEMLSIIGITMSILLGLYYSSHYSYLLFHSLVEIATIAIGFTLFILTWNGRRFLDNDCLKLLGIGYAFIACIDLIHSLAYKGMNVFPAHGANLPTQLWIAARYLQAVTLCVAPILISRKISERILFIVYLAIVSVIFVLVFSGNFPDCYVEGEGLTPFKVISEYAITALLLFALFFFYKTRTSFSRRIYLLILSSIICTALSELSFSAYLSVYGFTNMFGHFLKLAAYYLIYRALLVTGFREPYELIFLDLKKTENALRKAHDSLEEQVRERTAQLANTNQELMDEIIEHQISEVALHRLNRELQAISNCNQTLMRAMDEQSLLQDICRIVCDEAGYRMAWVGYVENDDAKNVRPVAWAGVEEGYLADVDITWADAQHGRNPFGAAILSGENVSIQDFATVAQDSPWCKSALQRGYRSGIALPLKDDRTKVFGVLCIYSEEPEIFTPAEMRLLEELAGDLAFGIIVLHARIQRKNSDDALRKSETELREAQRLAQIGSWELDLCNNVLSWSEEVYRIFELDHGSFGASYEAFLNAIHPDDREKVDSAYVSSLETRKPYSITHRLLMSDGSIKYVHERCESVFDSNDRPLSSRGTIQDVTKSTLAEQELRRIRNYLSNIINSMPAVLVGLDCDGAVTQWNRRAEETSGITFAEALGKPFCDLIPDFSPWIETMRNEVGQRRPASMEKLLIEKQGERRFYDLMLYPLVTNGVEGTVVRIEDATEKTRIQEMMIQTEKMMSIGGLAAGMAHEINNPLGIITQGIQNIERRVSPELPANRQTAEEIGVNMDQLCVYFERRQIPEFIAGIREAASRASRIITNMLRFSRRTDATMQSARLEDVIEQALELAANDYDLKKKFDFRSIMIVRDFAPYMPDVPMLATEIEQVLLNLLKNAAQAMTDNPPERKPRIVLRIRREERYAVMDVEDNGPGMSEDIRYRVFEPFFTTKEPGIGTGLGLSVSYMIVTQNHKGLMEVVSTPGNGARFTVRLPLPE